MLTVLESLELSTKFLQNKGIESPRLNAELLLSHILNCKRLELYLRFNQPLNSSETNTYRNYISRRGNFEPYQYIIGEVEFYGLRILVDKNVLIPRQDTEILIEAILSKYSQEDLKLLDIGTGSGNIPITLATHLSNSKIIATDISQNAILIAEKNRKLHNMQSRIGFIKSDFINDNLDNYKNKFDIVVSNPPYVNNGEFKTLQKEITEYEPQIAVTDFSDGLKFYKVISKKSKNLLKHNGMLFFEVGKGQSEDVKNIMLDNGFTNIEIVKDFNEIDRVVFGVFSTN